MRKSLLLVLLPWVLVSCGTPPTGSGPSSGLPIAHAQSTAAQADSKLGEAEPVLQSLTPENVNTQKPVAISLVSGARKDIKTVETDLGVIAKQDDQQVKQIAVLTAKPDPTKTRLQSIGLWTLLAGIGLLVLGIFGSSFLPAPLIRWARSLGVGILVFGLITLTIGVFFTAITWIIAGLLAAGVVSGLTWIYFHKKLLVSKLIPTPTPKV